MKTDSKYHTDFDINGLLHWDVVNICSPSSLSCGSALRYFRMLMRDASWSFTSNSQQIEIQKSTSFSRNKSYTLKTQLHVTHQKSSNCCPNNNPKYPG